MPRGIEWLAVLPFENVGADPETEYLSEGLTESVINGLSERPGLRIMARSTVFRYKNTSEDPRVVGPSGVCGGTTPRRLSRLQLRIAGSDPFQES